MAYRYQKELDLLEATRGELNITDAQYNELTDAIKAQGGSAEGGDEPNAEIPGYETVATITRDGGFIKYAVKAINYAWNSFEDGLPVEIIIGKDTEGDDYIFQSTQACMYGKDDEFGGPQVLSYDGFNFADGKITGITQANQVPEQSGSVYGQLISGQFQIRHEPSDADLEQFKKNFKIKIG